MKILIERDGLKCMICHSSLEKEWDELLALFELPSHQTIERQRIDIDVDHIIPRSKGGGPRDISNIKNLRLTHKHCNNKKGSALIFIPNYYN